MGETFRLDTGLRRRDELDEDRSPMQAIFRLQDHAAEGARAFPPYAPRPVRGAQSLDHLVGARMY